MERDLLTGLPAGGGGRPRERADAARNRGKVLAAAARLFAEREPREVTMGDIARAAGVGRGTLYRRYPDTNSVALALLDEHERDLQERLLRGEPPLGPGAPPGERLAAFLTAMVELLEEHIALVLGAEGNGARLTTGAYGFWRAHVRALLAEAAVPDPDALADALLAPLASEVYSRQRAQGLTPERIAAGLARLARAAVRA
ncbi:TetR/AcrR family transcriptional regulator [Actinomadura algeriensis]|uniref:AcrR family transcriptional regulator n=1 Tax=Actinomadura algeriensis TaxID=1679523 RepID=A0ABR9JKD8_9ACTN|nr:TetR/AcrR family transcriptional regulator [Actinomadura algeriensis]MBE1531025.1 AcrR family transcriptional regulator [Actinomadura algeriensis]